MTEISSSSSALCDAVPVQTIRVECSVEVLNLLPHGIVLLDGLGVVQFANAAAVAVSRARDGITIENKRLRAVVQSEQVSVLRLIRATVRGSGHDQRQAGGRVTVSRPSGRRHFVVYVLPVGIEGALIVIVDIERNADPLFEVLRKRYRLTPAELRVTSHLLQGESLKNVAERLGVTVTTARTHLQHIFDKTNTRRQVDLIRLLSTVTTGGLVACFGGTDVSHANTANAGSS